MQLTEEQKQTFATEGYLIFPGFFSDEEMLGYKSDMDQLETSRAARESTPFLCEMPNLGPLIVHPEILSIVEQVMGPDFAFHHLHATRQDAGTRGVHWHQDYEQEPQTNRAHTMVHLFYYFNGLNGEVGDLLVLPRTQNTIVGNSALAHFGTNQLPGEIVVNDLPPGSAVLVHSALWHARRAQPGGEGRPRYFADASYCQAGVKWPSYGGQQWREILTTAREKLGHEWLFAEDKFFDIREGRSRWRNRPGSIALELKDA